MKTTTRIQTSIIPSVERQPLSPSQVEREFANLLKTGIAFKTSGSASKNPKRLLSSGLKPQHRIDLFDTKFYLTNTQQIPELCFLVAYVVQPNAIYSRIFYKDLSLCWRAASHYTLEDGNLWIGKGDTVEVMQDGFEAIESNEKTTDLPLEMQTAIEKLSKWPHKRQGSIKPIKMVLRKAPADRIEPYQEFVAPRAKAQSNPKNLINRNKSIARFTKKNDPSSLKITKGFEPDFLKGIIEYSTSTSKLYGGKLKRYRIISKNRKVQYCFIAGKKHVWIIPPQATTTELSSFGVRTIDVNADDDLSIPGYEYHHEIDTPDGPELYSQIPLGFAGEPCPSNEIKADASPWLNQIPLIQEFRKKVLKTKKPK